MNIVKSIAYILVILLFQGAVACNEIESILPCVGAYIPESTADISFESTLSASPSISSERQAATGKTVYAESSFRPHPRLIADNTAAVRPEKSAKKDFVLLCRLRI